MRRDDQCRQYHAKFFEERFSVAASVLTLVCENVALRVDVDGTVIA
jgi:hypothetical protein